MSEKESYQHLDIVEFYRYQISKHFTNITPLAARENIRPMQNLIGLSQLICGSLNMGLMLKVLTTGSVIICSEVSTKYWVI